LRRELELRGLCPRQESIAEYAELKEDAKLGEGERAEIWEDAWLPARQVDLGVLRETRENRVPFFEEMVPHIRRGW
jgi:hypothetical protein